MKRFRWYLVVLVVLGMTLAACGGDDPEVRVPGSGVCPTTTEGTLLYTYEAQGYCVLYPDTHQPFETTESETVFAVNSLQDVSNPRVSINVTDAAGMDTETAAAGILAVFGMPDSNPPGSAVVDGAEAVVLDNMPGQDINRRVIVVHNGRLYDLTFSPIGPDYGELGEQTEQVYAMMLDSFTFLP